MPTKRLTDLFVERVKPPAKGRVEYFDAVFGGLALRVTDCRRKSWSMFYRINGRLRRFTIGHYPAIKPAQARREAQCALERVRAGFDPSVEKKLRQLTRSSEANTFAIVLQDYLNRHGQKNLAITTYTETKRMLERDVLPFWRDRPIGSITRRDVIVVLDSIAERRAEVQANRTLARLRALFNWAVEKDRLASSPITGMKPPTKEQSRDRALRDPALLKTRKFEPTLSPASLRSDERPVRPPNSQGRRRFPMDNTACRPALKPSAGTITSRRCEKPADMPVVQASKFELVINVQTASTRPRGAARAACARRRGDRVGCLFAAHAHGSYWQLVLQKSKVAAPRIFRENIN